MCRVFISVLTKNDSVACNSFQPNAKHTSGRKKILKYTNNNLKKTPNTTKQANNLNCKDYISDSVNFVAYRSRVRLEYKE